jgi:Fe-S oxidoreductase
MLRIAKLQLRQIVDALRPQIDAGVPIVGLEPSCVAVFRDELGNLFPDDVDAQRLAKQTFTLAEWLCKHGWQPPHIEGRAIVQAHCHHVSVLEFDPERELLERTGLDVDVVASGCCGLAGSYGYERGEKYEISMRCAEDVLLPAIRENPNAIVLADGFSCRSQIEHGAGRQALHLAELLARALPDAALAQLDGHAGNRSARIAAIVGAGIAAGGGIVLLRRHG